MMAQQYLAPSEIRFSQDSISNRFRHNTLHGQCYIGETLDELISNPDLIDSIPVINVFLLNGLWYTEDNRRLWVFRKAEKLGFLDEIPVFENFESDFLKFTTKNNGESVIVRGNPGGNIWRKEEKIIMKRRMQRNFYSENTDRRERQRSRFGLHKKEGKIRNIREQTREKEQSNGLFWSSQYHRQNDWVKERNPNETFYSSQYHKQNDWVKERKSNESQYHKWYSTRPKLVEDMDMSNETLYSPPYREEDGTRSKLLRPRETSNETLYTPQDQQLDDLQSNTTDIPQRPQSILRQHERTNIRTLQPSHEMDVIFCLVLFLMCYLWLFKW